MHSNLRLASTLQRMTTKVLACEQVHTADDVSRKAAEEEQTHASAKRSRSDSTPSSAELKASSQAQRITRLLGKIQHRLTRKQNDTWILKNIEDVGAISALVKNRMPEKTQRKDLVLVLDHFISAVLLSAFATDPILSQLSVMLGNLVGVHEDIDDYIRQVDLFVSVLSLRS